MEHLAGGGRRRGMGREGKGREGEVACQTTFRSVVPLLLRKIGVRHINKHP
jgi:hypothetical protein